MTEIFDEEVGLLIKMLGKEDVDLVVDGDDEDKVCRVAKILDEEFG